MYEWMRTFGFKIERVGEIRWRANPTPVTSLANRMMDVEEVLMDTFFLWKTVEGDH